MLQRASIYHSPIAAILERKRRLHLGCGRDVRPGYLNVDRVPLRGVDVVLDLESPLPFADATFDEVFSSHVLEHVDRFMELMAELHRISAPGARLRHFVPHLSFFGSYTDPTHRRTFGYHSFDYFADDGDYNFYTPTRFRIVAREIRFYWINNTRRRVRGRVLTWLINRAPLLYERFLCWMLPANEVYFELEPAPPQPARAAAR
ncbi:MAG TPA: methyltransferase domain-containing protein [Thermoanaerobaculia bacterium]|nr:methyltransferase domain-containing protein [Thermoanaerobaculia bacterium]